ncbi:MAG: hypothetical protein J7K77_01685 [Dehalococcoidales bacterium]|nr:hypothetical protein [Dehalococcoidales bacterium]
MVSFKNAQAERDVVASTQVVHQDRVRHWVESLADQLRRYYEAWPGKINPDIRVFSKDYDKNKRDFGLNEYLYDILVCRVGKVTSAKQGKELCYIRKAIWQVESEFALDTR